MTKKKKQSAKNHKKKKKKISRTLQTYFNDSNEQHLIFNFISHESKNVFNHYMFCMNIYNKFKSQLCEDVYYRLINDPSVDVNQFIQTRFKIYYDYYSKHFLQFKNNSNLIYDFIASKYLIITNKNYQNLYENFSVACSKLDGIIYDRSNSQFVFYDVIEHILTSFYLTNFFYVKKCLLHGKPIKKELQIKSFIEHVKAGKLQYNNSTLLQPKLFKLIGFMYPDIDSEQNLIRKFALSSLTNCSMYRDTIINVMDKAYCSYKSYAALKFKGKRANKPNYLEKDGRYVIPLFCRSFNRIDNNIRICLGNYVRQNYNEICKTDYEIIKQNKKTIIYKDNKGKSFDGGFMFIKIPDQIKNKNKKINLIQIVPKYGGYKFKMNFTYEKEINIVEKEVLDGDIAVDLGKVNLMTIYDPDGEQYIIKGGQLVSINEYYNKKIADHQSKISYYGLKTCSKTRRMLIKRDNKIDNMFNCITSKLYEMYKSKAKIIIGYNEQWKTNLNLGRNNNRQFYQIPYSKLIKKLRDKFGGDRIIEVEESYTSKADSMSLEEIKYHENYEGKRIERGLYSSKTGYLINADLNGAINIMRKHYINNGTDLKEIKGKNIRNPRVLKINRTGEVRQ